MPRCTFAAFLCAATGLCLALPAAEIGRYEKFELTFPAQAEYSNPYDPATVDLSAEFTAPSGKKLRVPGFFYQDYRRSGSQLAETLTPAGGVCWKVRFAPSELGPYRYRAMLKDSRGERLLGEGGFVSVPSKNHGFVRARGRSFVFDDGTFYFPIGVNAPWFQHRADMKDRPGTGRWGASTYGADAMFKQYADYGADFVHFWICSSNSTVEKAWAHPSIGCAQDRMSQSDSWAMDYIVNRAREQGIYILPILKFKNQRDPEPKPEDFLLFRYAVARWGYSTSIFGWEFCKEGCTSVDLVEKQARYMKEIDPYDHLRTTSIWNRKIVPPMFASPLLDIAQLHDYPWDCARTGGPGLPYDARVEDLGLYRVHQKIHGPTFSVPGPFPDYGKPFFMGETGLLQCKEEKSKGEKASLFYDQDPDGLIFHGDVWGMVMASSGAISPWYYRWDAQGAWSQLSQFRGVAAYVRALGGALGGRPIPDSAVPFTNYGEDRDASASDPRLSVTGRKNGRFAMLRVQNMTTTWAAVLRDHKTPQAVSGTVVLHGMDPGGYRVVWMDTRTGALLRNENSQASQAGLELRVTDLTQDAAAIVTVEK